MRFEYKLSCFVISSSLLFAGGLSLANAQTCLDYRDSGVSECGIPDQQVVKKKVPSPVYRHSSSRPKASNQVVMRQAEFEKKVEEFYEYHGKPPREFVEFHLDPSLDNAIKWALKYEEMMQRGRDISKAWQQAKEIIKGRREAGEDLPVLKSALPSIDDFSKFIPKASEFPLMDPFSGLNGVDPGGISQGTGRIVDGRIGGVAAQIVADRGPIRVNYYFSAQCPYCKKFEPGLQKVIKELGPENIQVTCVDMTPSGTDEKNIHGKVDCGWRPVMPGEGQQMGVESTPTLLVQVSKESDMERLAGMISEKDLRKYFIEKRQQ